MISEKVMSPLGPEDAKRFRDVCLASGYTQSRLSELSGLLVPPPSDRLPAEVEASLCEGGAPLHLLASLFFLGIPVDAELAGAVLPSGFLSLCMDCGLIVEDGQSLRAVALVVPVGESLFASDLQRIEHQDDDRFVPTVCDAALHLSAVAIRKPVGKTLDLCSGFALHGILSSPLSEEVVASDFSPSRKALKLPPQGTFAKAGSGARARKAAKNVERMKDP